MFLFVYIKYGAWAKKIQDNNTFKIIILILYIENMLYIKETMVVKAINLESKCHEMKTGIFSLEILSYFLMLSIFKSQI